MPMREFLSIGLFTPVKYAVSALSLLRGILSASLLYGQTNSD